MRESSLSNMSNLDNANLFIRSIRLVDGIAPEEFDHFPLNINALKLFVPLRFTSQVTVFNGENGCGKSTLIEAIAAKLDIPIMGGNKNLGSLLEGYDHGEEQQSELSKYLFVEKGLKRPHRTFFFRAESFYKLADILSHDSWVHLHDYGNKDLLEQSHGESFMDFMDHQLSEDSLYILDEPEAALSPQNQLKLMVMIDSLSKKGTQFIIATHSPFILGYKNARIINLDNGMEQVSFKETNIYALYHRFIDDPEGYQKTLFED